MMLASLYPIYSESLSERYVKESKHSIQYKASIQIPYT